MTDGGLPGYGTDPGEDTGEGDDHDITGPFCAEPGCWANVDVWGGYCEEHAGADE